MWEKVKKYFNQLSPARLIVAYYLVTVTISTILLSLPIARKEGEAWSLIDAIFTSVSAVSVTGLTTVNVSETFTLTGKWILLFVIQIGGIGIMTLGTFFWLIFRKKIGLKGRQLMMTDQNQMNLSGIVRLMKQIIIVFFLIEVIGAFVLSVYFLTYYPTWQEAFFYGIFMSVSATTNAGFDFTGASLMPFKQDYFVQTVHMMLIILGAIGFPVLIEVKDWLRKRKEHFHFSLFAKLTAMTYFSLVIFGAVFFLIFEWNQFLLAKSWHESLFYALFQSVSTRSAGLVTVEPSLFSNATLILFSGLMFIGASPSSVGGGIRTTTFAVNLLFFYHYAKGNRNIKVFKREIHEEDVLKAFVVSAFATMLVFLSTVILCFTEDFSVNAIVFEVCSAFGTSGMSMGITGQLSFIGKIVIILLMFIGRVGIISFLFMIGGREKKENFHYPKEKIIIG